MKVWHTNTPTVITKLQMPLSMNIITGNVTIHIYINTDVAYSDTYSGDKVFLNSQQLRKT